ncbi:MAG: DUF4249 domain-containing protein [Chitinophagaceae bacterium]|nr:MAG: DUF4249 domain-containing protein [Chitinophagaceae bacterium]
MNSKIFIACLLTSIVSLSSCEKVIDLDLPDGEKIIFMDAWINDQTGLQTIKLLQAVNFQDQAQPGVVPGAAIKLTDLTAGKTYDFVFNNGAYHHNPGNTKAIGVVGHQYKLTVTLNGETFDATDYLSRVTKFDSLTLEYKEGSGDFEKQGFYAEFHAKDLPGATDYYWIQTFRNGTRNTYLNDMVSVDGSFYEGISDGYEFIPPFTEGVTSGEKPYQKGDEVKVVMRSISKSSFGFWEQAINQISSGGLFSEVLQNIPSNITNTNTQSKTRIYGWFGTVAETSITRKVE